MWGLFKKTATHVWVETMGHILDVTQSQFGGPDVVVVPWGDPRYEDISRGLEVDRLWSRWGFGPCDDAEAWAEMISDLGKQGRDRLPQDIAV